MAATTNAQLPADLLQLLREAPLFVGVDDDTLHNLAQRAVLRRFAIGTTVVEEGQRGEHAYLVYSGRVRLLKEAGQPRPVTIALIERGGLIGDSSLITDTPYEFTARAADDTVLVQIPEQALAAITKIRPELGAYFDRMARDRGLAALFRTNAVFSAIPPAQVRELVSQVGEAKFAADETIFSQGDKARRFFLIRSGSVRITLGPPDSTPIAVLGPEQYFGERALLSDEKRTATVTAVTDTVCATIDSANFRALVERIPELRQRVETGMRAYIDVAPVAAPPRAEIRVAPPQEPLEAAAPRAKPDRKAAARSRRMPFVAQLDETDCGPACLSMVARYHGRRIAIARLRDLASVGREGTSLFNLARAAEAIGLAAKPIRASGASLDSIELPAVAHWAGYHYIVVYRVTADKVTVADPAVGVHTLPRAEFEKQWTGRMLVLNPTNRLAEQPEPRSQIGHFLRILGENRRIVGEIVLASILLNLLGLATPLFIQTIVDRVVVHQDRDLLDLMLIGMLAVGIFEILAIMIRRYLLVYVSTRITLRLSTELLRRLLLLPLRFFQRRKIGDLLQRFEDNEQATEFLTGKAPQTFLDVAMVVVYLVTMFIYNASLALVFVLFIPPYVILTLYFSPVLRRRWRQVLERQGAMTSHLIETVNQVDSIKAATAEMPMRWRYEAFAVQHANAQFRSMRSDMIMDAISRGLMIALNIAVLWYGATLVLDGKLTIGQLVAFNVLVGLVMPPITTLVGMWDEVQHFAMSLQRLADVHDAEPEQDTSRALITAPTLRGLIRFDDVSFRYDPDGAEILSHITLEIQPGQTVALVGRSGSGKTTLISLLQGFHAPTSGRITLDGLDLRNLWLPSVRAQIGVVPQAPAVFTGTIRENIAIGEPAASTARIMEAARLANAHDFIMALPLGYETMIGEVGISLSGGQNQRVAIARALLRDPTILVLDEATSALDTESERAIQANLATILGKRSAIVIAHRLSTVRHADKIVVLDQGAIIEQGTHAELFEQRGLYYHLVSQQIGQGGA